MIDLFKIHWSPNPNKEQLQSAVYRAIENILEWEIKDKVHDVYVIKRLLTRSLLWDLTEAINIKSAKNELSAKYNLQYWSKGAIELLGTKKSGSAQRQKGLRHEHVVERGRIYNYLMDKKIDISDRIKLISDEMNIPACVVIKEEHKGLGKLKDSAKGWKRYLDAGIQVYDRKNKDWVSKDQILEMHASIDKTIFAYEIKAK